MNPDAFVLFLLAFADLAFLIHLRMRQAKRDRLERMMASLCMAVRRDNALDDLSPRRYQPLLFAPAAEGTTILTPNYAPQGSLDRQLMVVGRG